MLSNAFDKSRSTTNVTFFASIAFSALSVIMTLRVSCKWSFLLPLWCSLSSLLVVDYYLVSHDLCPLEVEWLQIFSIFRYFPSIHFFRRFLASGCSSFKSGIACKIKPFCTSGKAEHSATAHIPVIFFTVNQERNLLMLANVRYRVDIIRWLVAIPSTAPFCVQYGGKCGANYDFCLLIKWTQKPEYV